MGIWKSSIDQYPLDTMSFVCKLFTISSSSILQSHWTNFNQTQQNILGWKDFKFIKRNCHSYPYPIISKIHKRNLKVFFSRKYISEIWKCPSPVPLGQFQPNLAQNILGGKEFKFVGMKGHSPLTHPSDMMKLWKVYIRKLNI